jgi:hypothetical protein
LLGAGFNQGVFSELNFATAPMFCQLEDRG